MTTTDDRPEVTCPSWCAEHSEPDPGVDVHSTPVVSLPGDDPDDAPRMDGLSRVWAVAYGADAPEYFVHISREGITADEVRATAAQLLAEVDRIEALQRRDDSLVEAGDVCESHTRTDALGGLAPMLRELREVRDLPDDDPRRQAALADKRRLLDLVDHYESA